MPQMPAGMPAMTPEQMAQLQAMMGGAGGAGGANPMAALMGGAGGAQPSQQDEAALEAEAARVQGWTTLYPLYIDAKRAFGKGQRRTPYDKSVLWPQAQWMFRELRSMGIEAKLQVSAARHCKAWHLS